MKRRRIVCAVVAGLSLAGLSLLGGCSGGAGHGYPSAATAVVTRANENNYSLDALVLAGRESVSAWISADIAARRDADLTAIRQKYPALTDLHPRPDGDMRQMLVSIPADASWFSAWNSGTTATGVPDVDALLTEFKVVRVSKVADFPAYTTFLLTFEDPLQIERLAERFKAASDAIKNAGINGLVGDGDNILYAADGDGRKYIFSHGWGDCPSGCTSRHFWTVRIAGDGTVSVQESGTPLPAS